MVSLRMERENSHSHNTDANRGRVVESIRSRNRGAGIEFLDRFDDQQLEHYLMHLEHAEEPRGSSWIRPAGVPGIVCRESRI